MIQLVLIVVHAGAAVVAFAVGTTLLFSPRSSANVARLRTYAIAMAVSMAALFTVVAYDWTALSPPKRVVFAGLAVLGVVLIVRTLLAVRLAQARPADWAERFLAHLGFVLISLFDGFCIVLAFDLRLPVWAIVGAGVVGVLAGVFATKVAIRRASEPIVPARQKMS